MEEEKSHASQPCMYSGICMLVRDLKLDSSQQLNILLTEYPPVHGLK